ncbi:MAG TPA: hypothetical protein VH743_10680, partial [Beijerinckiaceae bacterium]
DAMAPETIRDFEGAGAAGGDDIEFGVDDPNATLEFLGGSLYALHDGADPIEYISITSSNGQALVRDLDYSFFVF